MLRFWSGVWARSKYALLVAGGWILQQIISWITGKWGDEIAAQPGVQRFAGRFMIWISHHPESYIIIALLAIMCWIMWRALKDAQQPAPILVSQTTSTPPLPSAPPKPAVPPSLKLVMTREVIAYRSSEGYVHVTDPNSVYKYNPAMVAVFRNEPGSRNASRVGASITFTSDTHQVAVPSAMWLGDGGRIDIGVGAVAELILAISDGSRMLAVEWRKHAGGIPPPVYTQIVAKKYAVVVRLFNEDGLSKELKFDLTVDPIHQRGFRLEFES